MFDDDLLNVTFSRLFTQMPRLSGTEADKASAEYIKGFWKSEHLDKVEMLDYDVLLSYPDELKFNKYIRKSDSDCDSRSS